MNNMKQYFAKRSSSVFRQIIFIIMSIFGLVFFLFFKIYQKVYLYGGILVHSIKTACKCTQMTQLIAMHPLIFGALFVLSLIIITFLSYSFYKLIKLLIQTRNFSAQYLANEKPKHSAKLRQIIFDLHLNKKRIIEIREVKPTVFCFGLFRPKVCISSGLIKILRKDELGAVLLHEHQHMVVKEPLKLFVVKYFQSIFFFLPGIRTVINKYITFSELAADERASDDSVGRSKLARAIFKISEAEEKQLLRSELALSFFSSVIEERVNWLSDNDYVPKFKLWSKGFLFGLGLVTFGILTVFVFLSGSAKAYEMHNDGSCGFGKNEQSTALICDSHNYTEICESGNQQLIAKCSTN